MSGWIWALILLAALVPTAWLFRFAGRLTRRPYFRDMEFLTAFGWMLGLTALLFGLQLYFFNEQAQFFRWAVQGLAIFAVATYFVYKWNKEAKDESDRWDREHAGDRFVVVPAVVARSRFGVP